MKIKEHYSLLIVTTIPVKLIEDNFYSLDLWCKDISVNAKYVDKIGIICPESQYIKGSLVKVPSDIEVNVINTLFSLKIIKSIVERYDVIQLAGGRPFWQSFNEFLILLYAKKIGKLVLFSISSNRVKLTLLNSSGKNSLKKFKAKLVASSIYLTQKIYSKYSDGVLLVGDSLKTKLGINNSNTYIGLASWINEDDIIAKEIIQKKLTNLPSYVIPKLCICARLEVMKGIHIAIEALVILRDKYNITPMLSIYGEGPELNNLKNLAKELKVTSQVDFRGYISYGSAFYKEISNYDLMLLTNLSDEQPRLIFDAISQGVIPICPNTPPYKSVGLDSKLLYDQGSSVDLARIIQSYTDKHLLSEMTNLSRLVLEKCTIDEMHLNRSNWIKELL